MFFMSLRMRDPEEFHAESVYVRLDAFTRQGNEAALQSTVININILQAE